MLAATSSEGFFRLHDWETLFRFVSVQLQRPFSSPMLLWEWGALALGLLLFTNVFLFRDSWMRAVASRVRSFTEHPWRAILTCALLPMVIRVGLLPIAPVKPPSVHDEFSLLLLADTLASGRLTNKPHLFWPHFETIHVIQQPTYGSMYPPGSGLFLAIGKLLGHPWIGLLLGMGLMCGAICWALQAWIEPEWAFVTTVLAALQIGIGSYWINSYIGATALPAIAGALMLGAIPRFLRDPKPGHAVWFALAVVAFENSRPYEGTLLAAGLFGLAVWWYRKKTFGSAPVRGSYLRPAVLVLIAGAAFTLYDDWRVTGSLFKTGYVVNRQTYGWPENLAYIPPVKVVSRHPNLANMYGQELGNRPSYSTFGRMVNNWFARWLINWEFYLGPGLTLPILLLPWALRGSEIKKIFYVVAGLLLINLAQLMAFPQHISPITSLLYLLVAAGLRELWRRAPAQHWVAGRLIAGLFLCVSIGAGLTLFREELGIRQVGFWEWPHFGYFRIRAAIQQKLERFPGKQLVLVRYDPSHFAHEEWVYNAANIDRSHIVWANSMSLNEDEQLRAYFRDRQAWIIEPDRDPSALLPWTTKTYCREESE